MAAKRRQRNGGSKQDSYKWSNGKKQAKTQKTVEDNVSVDPIWLVHPRGDWALFILLFLVRFCSAILSHITDCDETYNSWEPSHFLLYRNGQQTWEYSPQYAQRSYMYLLVHTGPAKLFSLLFEPNPMYIFYFVRCLLSVSCTLSEIYFYKNVCRQFGVHIARLTLAFLLLSSGMFISSVAFLPSSFSMYFSTVGIAAWFGRKYALAIFATAISCLIGWPFVALLGVPIAVEMLFRRKKLFEFSKWVIISALIILVPMICIDSVYYGKLVIAPYNIIKYNFSTSHVPELYGTEPFNYYLLNGFLNLNFIFIGALVTPIFLLLVRTFVPVKSRPYLCLPYWYSLAPMYIWIAVFFFEAHKEEHFLYPIYPLICLHGAITVDAIQKLYFFLRNRILKHTPTSNHYLKYTTHIMVSAIVICGLFGLSRSLNLYKGYHAPIEIMTEVNKLGINNQIPKDMNINFCVGKEWHRFPNSFFFPSENWKLRYLKSEFRGQLPQPYLDHEYATSINPPNFNDINREEPSRYFDVNECHFIMDLDNGRETILEPNYSRQSNRFTIIKSVEFLDTSRSYPLFRSFYFPFVSTEFCTFASYNLLQNTKFKFPSNKHKPPKIFDALRPMNFREKVIMIDRGVK